MGFAPWAGPQNSTAGKTEHPHPLVLSHLLDTLKDLEAPSAKGLPTPTPADETVTALMGSLMALGNEPFFPGFWWN